MEGGRGEEDGLRVGDGLNNTEINLPPCNDNSCLFYVASGCCEHTVDDDSRRAGSSTQRSSGSSNDRRAQTCQHTTATTRMYGYLVYKH